MVENQNRATLVLCGLVAIIFVGLVFKFQLVAEEARVTGARLAKVWMLDSVQRYKEAWLLQGEPKQLEMDGFHLTMTERGLVSPFSEQGDLDCAYWLAVHYPQRKIMTIEPSAIDGTIKNDLYICNYTYKKSYKVIVTANTNNLISVEILSE
ncbi:MSHA biogenesis protein MshF [Vibrio sp. J1-1]|uniref:MSHA biogenesis protein MshF n=1 Tax=Vibrio sp. J1-1 TaxID=2912251 RepID=UPI001F30945A|nr:MSHA biogenesis protein MshF [Vibrionaceae bacterium]MCF7483788.1 MSHA biogenesis protein MshF [Vibrio sp. J1-1]